MTATIISASVIVVPNNFSFCLAISYSNSAEQVIAAVFSVVAVVVARETKGLALETIDIADAKNLATEAELAKAGLK